MRIKILMPRFMDANNHNAQNINARNMLRSFVSTMDVTTVHFNEPDNATHNLSKSIRLLRWRFYAWHILSLYVFNRAPVFYPGHQWFDAWGVKLRKLLGRKAPVISTLEGIPWISTEKKVELEEIVGHEIHCMSYDASKYYIQVLEMADHVIAISPFLAEIGKFLFGDKFSVIPLGVDTALFHAAADSQKRERVTVVCAGTVYPLKRPELFLKLAEGIPEADFIWYGGGRGDLLDELKQQIKAKGLANIEFKGPLGQSQLADEFRQADLFVLPSMSEGVPKVSQEAAACGLPLVMFGFYEAHSLEEGKNGRVVWNDEEFIDAVASLTRDRKKLDSMGAESARMAANWSWEIVAQKWLTQINHCIGLQK